MKSILTAMSFLLLITTTAPAQTVKVNWQKNAPFADYRTYTWKADQSDTNSFYEQWIKPDVDAQLAAKHLSKVTADQKPDLMVVYHLKTQELMDATTTSDGFGCILEDVDPADLETRRLQVDDIGEINVARDHVTSGRDALS
jgi:uncharacterized protein DUF4136